MFGLLGLPMYVCASGATPLVAIFLANGASGGAALAFLITGPATNITTFGIVSKLHGKKVAFALGFGAFVISIGLGYLLNATIDLDLSGVGVDPHEHNEWWKILATFILIGLFAVSFVKRGARVVIKEIFNPHIH